MPKATSQKRLNRDHARQQQRPMVEEEVIAAQLEALVTQGNRTCFVTNDRQKKENVLK
jgi:hypothetical protein